MLQTELNELVNGCHDWGGTKADDAKVEELLGSEETEFRGQEQAEGSVYFPPLESGHACDRL